MNNMFIKIPFESKIDFKTNIAEITKMSLEHDFNISESTVLGNFYISGEYKSHEVSVNKDKFNYTLPFTVELREDIKEDSLELNIEDFSYDICNNKELIVKIEYSLKADLKDELFERVDEEELKSELKEIDNFLESEINKNEKEEILRDDKKEDKENEKIDKEVENTINNTIIQNEENEYVTYHIHIVNDNENIDTISNMFKVPVNIINEYNDTSNIETGSKLIIPKIDE